MCVRVGAQIEGVGDNSGFTVGLAACGRIWGVCAPDVGTPLCAAGWLIFITAHNDGAREWGLGWKKARRKQKSGERRERRREEGRDKGNSEAEKLCFLLVRCQSGKGCSAARWRPRTVKCSGGAAPVLITAETVQS